MFQTNPPEFDSAPTGDEQRAGSDDNVREASASEPRRLPKQRPAKDQASPEFVSLEAFTQWLDHQLATLEASHPSFETASSVRGFYGR